MSEFIVSARKYRPDTFKSVVGQHSITSTLKNALASNKLGHAYLFTGPRGVGKTTCARIFAKTINCSNITEDHEPCNACESCASFNENRSYNIHELDAASNNSVEDIRLLIEKVRIKPQLGHYSVYIIDEVHMLSTAAFNAFLKTLEEPPEHAIFILATTEKHKILPTILSRCQIFDFNRITVEDAAGHLAYVAQSEGYDAEPDALTIIAQKADGGMRDALSMFDQIVSFSGGEITYQSVIENLNVLDYEFYFRLVEALLAGNITDSLLVFDEVLDKGFDGHHFITGLASHLRDLLVCKDPATLKLLEVGASIKARYQEQAQNCQVAWLFRGIELANKADLSYKASQNKRLLVELALMQVAQLNAKMVLEAQQTVPQQQQPAPVKQPTSVKQAAPAKQEAKATQTQEQSKPEPTVPEPPKTENSAVAESQETYAGKRQRRKSSVSISAMKEQKNDGEAQENNTEESANVAAVVGNDPVSQEKVMTVWKMFAEQFITSPRMQTFFNTTKPILSGETTIEIPIGNKLQADSLKAQEEQMSSFFRQQLNNGAVSFVFQEIAKTEQKKVFTQDDKFNFLAEKNPILNKLKSAFSLDF